MTFSGIPPGGGTPSTTNQTIGQCVAWKASSGSLPAVRSSGMVFASSTTLFYCGGTDASDATNTIWTAPKSDPDNWSVSGNTLPTALFGAWYYTIGSTAYIVGGRTTGGGDVNTILTAPTSDLTDWTTHGDTFPVGAFMGFGDQMLIVDKVAGKIWIWGTRTTTVFSDTVYSATTAAPTIWTDSTKNFAAARGEAVTFRIGDIVYCCGGLNAGTHDDIYTAHISDLGDWSTLAGELPANLRGAIAAVVGDTVYFIGGQSSIIYAAPASSPVDFKKVGDLPTSQLGHRIVFSGDGVISILGGNDGAVTSAIAETIGGHAAYILGTASSNNNSVPVTLRDGTPSVYRNSERIGVHSWFTDDGESGIGLA